MRLPNQSVPSVDKAGRATETDFKFNKQVQRFMHEAGKIWETAKIIVGSPTGGDKGAGSINAETIYEQNRRVFVQTGNATGGVTFTAYVLGTPANGSTITPNPSNGLKQKLTNNVAGFTIAATAEIGDCEVHVTNGASAGTISFSGFKQWSGDPLTTTNAHEFAILILGFGTKAAYSIKALQ